MEVICGAINNETKILSNINGNVALENGNQIRGRVWKTDTI